MYKMSENHLCQIPCNVISPKETVLKSCQVFGGQDKRSVLGAIYCDIDCQYMSPYDTLLICQIGRESNGNTATNFLEIWREDASLFFGIHVGSVFEAQDIAYRPASHKNIKLSIKPEIDEHGSYSHIHFIVHDADDPDIYDAMYFRSYHIPEPQSIDRIAVILTPRIGYSKDYRPCGFPVGVNNLRSYGTREIPEILKPNFEWYGEEVQIKKGCRIVSKHYESYKLNALVNLKQWKEKI
jgi:hypothetical protein